MAKSKELPDRSSEKNLAQAVWDSWNWIVRVVVVVVGFFGFLASLVTVAAYFGIDSFDFQWIPWATPQATIPDVLVLDEGDARSLLAAAGLIPNVICQEVLDTKVTRSTVYDTDPQIGSRVGKGTTVTIYIRPPCS